MKQALLIVTLGVAVAGMVYLVSISGNVLHDLRPISELGQLTETALGEQVQPTGKVVEYEIVAKPGVASLVDGRQTRVWSYNNAVPGPEIRIAHGDTLRVVLRNELPVDTTIHFHGIRLPNHMDGVPGATQKPVRPGESFVYEFTPPDAGTYWFHPHVRSSEEVERGLYGTLVVEDAVSEEYSHDVVWVVDDWRLDADAQVAEPMDHPHDVVHAGRWGNVITVNGSTRETLQARPGERIRVRLVNTSNARIYRLNFGDLPARAIAVDGLYVRELFNPNGFEFAPGNRLDVDVTLAQDAGGQTFTVSDDFTGTRTVLATIAVTGSIAETPEFPLPHNAAVPSFAAPGRKPAVEFVFDGGMGSMMGRGMMSGAEVGVWRINGKSSPAHDAVSLPAGSVVHARMKNLSPFDHPMHLHGHFMKVIARNGAVQETGYFQDTIVVHANEVVDVALVVPEVGSWAFHCHVLEHAEAGMMTFIEAQ